MASQNTGYLGYSILAKVTDDVNQYPLDINDQLCSESGLPQHTKPNSASDPDYVAPILDETSCPIEI